MLKKSLFLIVLLAGSVVIAQDSPALDVGETAVLGSPEYSSYSHIDFPPAREIIKRTAIPNFKALNGVSVTVVSEHSDNEGHNWVELKRTDGKKFFRHYRTVWANLDKAVASGELLL